MLKELIDQFYRDRFKDREQKHFYVTDVARCPRQVYFKFKKYPKKETEPRVLRIFDNGEQTHTRIVSALFSLGVVQAAEVKTPHGQLFSGRADVIIGLDGKPCVVEIKSISKYKFDKLTAPDQGHLKQLQLYLHYFKIPKGIVLYENKDNQELKEFLIDYDESLVKNILKEFEVLEKQIKEDSIPPIPSDIEHWRCEYCEYQEECQKLV